MSIRFTQIRRETGKKSMGQVRCGDSRTHHPGPELCGGLREETDEKSVGDTEAGRFIYKSVSLIDVGVEVDVSIAMRLSSFHEIGAATGRRGSAFQPVFTSYK